MAKIWLVTGSSRGFGRELIKTVLAAGDSVVATARRPEQVKDLAEEYGGRILPVALDVTDPGAAREAIAAASDTFGRIDVVVNNAGYANSAPIEEMASEDFRAQVEVNLFGVVNVTRAALPVLRRQRSGTFVQFSSVGGRVGGTPGLGAYQTAKFAVEGFSEVLAAEVAPFGIKVIIVEPGAFRTDWQSSSMQMQPVSAEYESTVGKIHLLRQSTDGAQTGDPARAAHVIIAAVNDDTPPRRLLLGSDAVRLARTAGEQRTAETERWADQSASADFPAGE